MKALSRLSRSSCWLSLSLLVLLVGGGQAAAQLGTTSATVGTATATSSAAASTYTITVGKNASVSLAAQKQAAKDSQFMLQPGEDFPAEGGTSTSTKSSTATSTSAATSTAAASTAAAAAASHPVLSSGAIAGIAIGSSVVVLMAAALFFLLGRQRTLDDVIKKRESYSTSGPDMRHASMGGNYGSGFTPGSMSGSNSDAGRKQQQYRDYYDGNGYHAGPDEYLAPVPIAPRAHSPGMLADASDDGSNAQMSPPGSVVGGRQSYTSYTPGDDRLQVGRIPTSASRRGPHELFTPLDEDVPYEDHSAPPSPRRKPVDGSGVEYIRR
ncbi:hypothetical protein FGG08_002548 [Glutinoglossum americanum]|uniref:Uncharacterized protein n=1 Tax=Glutinoglossum americanum TaxID=1670608 RepID=A0A9P8I000_9PEZI|nr:hypothetical protein FGG08_002548 [Glutinoglossum americanum]